MHEDSVFNTHLIKDVINIKYILFLLPFQFITNNFYHYVVGEKIQFKNRFQFHVLLIESTVLGNLYYDTTQKQRSLTPTGVGY